MPAKPQLEQFIETCQTFHSSTACIELRAIAYRMEFAGEYFGRTYCLGAVAHVRRMAPDAQHPFSALEINPVNRFSFLREILPIDHLKDLFNRLSQERVTVQDQEMLIIDQKENLKLGTFDHDWLPYHRNEHLVHSLSRSNSVRVQDILAQDGIITRSIGAALNACQRPFWSLGDLYKEWLLLDQVPTTDYELTIPIQVYSDLKAEFTDKISLKAGQLLIQVDTDQLDPAGFSIGIIGRSEGDTVRETLQLSQDPVHEQEGQHLAFGSYQFPNPSFRKCQIILRYKGFFLQTDEIIDDEPWIQGALSATVNAYVPSDYMKAVLDGSHPRNKPQRQDMLEHAVCLILTLNQFTLLHFGAFKGAFHKEIDIVAFPANREYCLCVECTTQDSDGKVGSIKERTAWLEQKLGIPAWPVIATSANMEMVKDIRDRDVSIFATEDLQELFHLGLSGGSPETVWGKVRAKRYLPHAAWPFQ